MGVLTDYGEEVMLQVVGLGTYPNDAESPLYDAVKLVLLEDQPSEEDAWKLFAADAVFTPSWGFVSDTQVRPTAAVTYTPAGSDYKGTARYWGLLAVIHPDDPEDPDEEHLLLRGTFTVPQKIWGGKSYRVEPEAFEVSLQSDFLCEQWYRGVLGAIFLILTPGGGSLPSDGIWGVCLYDGHPDSSGTALTSVAEADVVSGAIMQTSGGLQIVKDAVSLSVSASTSGVATHWVWTDANEYPVFAVPLQVPYEVEGTITVLLPPSRAGFGVR